MTRVTGPWFLFGSAALLSACSTPDAAFERAARDTEPPPAFGVGSAPQNPSFPFEAPTATDNRWVFRGVPDSVVFEEAPGGGACTNPMDDACDGDYRAFIGLAWEHGHLTDESSLQDTIDGFLAMPARLDDSAGELPHAIADAWGVGFLFDALEQTPTRALRTYSGEAWGGRVDEYLLEDPWVGSFFARIHYADAVGPAPAVLAVHGHATEAADWPEAFDALSLVDAGVHVATIDNRMMYANAAQSSLNRELLLAGFTQQGLHAYEILLLHKVLRALPAIDPERVGYLGHSAGGNKGGLLIRAVDAFNSLVTDIDTEVRRADEGVPEYLEGFVPGLAPWQDLVNRYDTALVPVLKLDYGFPQGAGPYVDFFDETLQDPAT